MKKVRISESELKYLIEELIKEEKELQEIDFRGLAKGVGKAAVGAGIVGSSLFGGQQIYKADQQATQQTQQNQQQAQGMVKGANQMTDSDWVELGSAINKVKKVYMFSSSQQGSSAEQFTKDMKDLSIKEIQKNPSNFKLVNGKLVYTLSQMSESKKLKHLIKNILKEEMSHLTEMGRDDINLQAVLKKYDVSDEVTKKTIAKIVLGSVDYKNFNPIVSRVKIYKALRDMDYQDISYVTKMIGIR